MERIASRRNPLVLQYRAAARGVEPALLLDGLHLVQEALAAGVTLLSAIVVDDRDQDGVHPLVSSLERAGARVAVATHDVMSAVSPVRSSSPIVALAQPLEERPLFRGPDPLVLVASDVQDPGNLGAIVRVAEASGAAAVVAAGSSADPYGWKALRGSMGSALRLPVARRTLDDALKSARHHRCRIVATIPRGGASLFEADLTGSVAVLLGGEGMGLPASVVESADVRLSIPMQAPVESLNAAVAAALIAYESRRQRHLAIA